MHTARSQLATSSSTSCATGNAACARQLRAPARCAGPADPGHRGGRRRWSC
jgi:hypothetical protein